MPIPIHTSLLLLLLAATGAAAQVLTPIPRHLSFRLYTADARPITPLSDSTWALSLVEPDPAVRWTAGLEQSAWSLRDNLLVATVDGTNPGEVVHFLVRHGSDSMEIVTHGGIDSLRFVSGSFRIPMQFGRVLSWRPRGGTEIHPTLEDFRVATAQDTPDVPMIDCGAIVRQIDFSSHRGNPLGTLANVETIALHPDGDRFVVAVTRYNGAIELLDGSSRGSIVNPMRSPQVPAGASFEALRFVGERLSLVVGTSGGRVKLTSQDMGVSWNEEVADSLSQYSPPFQRLDLNTGRAEFLLAKTFGFAVEHLQDERGTDPLPGYWHSVSRLTRNAGWEELYRARVPAPHAAAWFGTSTVAFADLDALILTRDGGTTWRYLPYIPWGRVGDCQRPMPHTIAFLDATRLLLWNRTTIWVVELPV